MRTFHKLLPRPEGTRRQAQIRLSQQKRTRALLVRVTEDDRLEDVHDPRAVPSATHALPLVDAKQQHF
eukprot:CAMPEP_0113279246 /NCGR_PEP_ID=MMETSP0008_2-20120614/27064_1 /TAXON_ID=97485 /ORGANISM="Prymnesium parvum" /LENGTH=67 /DNA_ID=CAMNT_0000129381 /DNA_START=155 /DNA_END=358 /DNA_ORIENTATION=+ /assembly_acc=CAM_ASM_000153